MFKLLVACVLMLISTTLPAVAKQWVVDYTKSNVTFTGKQSGETFTGHFNKFDTIIDFDPQSPAGGKIMASIDMASAQTGNTDIDGSIHDPAWFDSKKFPEAKFVSTSITQGASPSCYKVTGQLSIKSISKQVDFPFCLAAEGTMMRAKGEVPLIRTDYSVGTGQWAGEGTVAHGVTVGLDILAK